MYLSCYLTEPQQTRLPNVMIAEDHMRRKEEKRKQKGSCQSEESEVYKMMLDTKIVQK